MCIKPSAIGWLVWTAGVSAQSWSLDDCMKYAVEHATEVKREVVNARQRKQDYQHAVAGFLPTVTGGVQGQYAWGRNIDPETNTYNNVTTFNNYYQLYAELNVFDGFIFCILIGYQPKAACPAIHFPCAFKTCSMTSRPQPYPPCR